MANSERWVCEYCRRTVEPPNQSGRCWCRYCDLYEIPRRETDDTLIRIATRNKRWYWFCRECKQRPDPKGKVAVMLEAEEHIRTHHKGINIYGRHSDPWTADEQSARDLIFSKFPGSVVSDGFGG